MIKMLSFTRKLCISGSFQSYNRGLLSTVAANQAANPKISTKSSRKAEKEVINEQTIVLTKDNIPKSPWKMRFLVTLIREKWLPDALAQMIFTPKARSDEVSDILKRGMVLAKIRYDAIPEELFVKEVITTKGLATKRARIMGRGRTGIGYKRRTHIRIVLEKINFASVIHKQESYNQKQKWIKRQQLVEDIRSNKKISIVFK